MTLGDLFHLERIALAANQDPWGVHETGPDVGWVISKATGERIAKVAKRWAGDDENLFFISRFDPQTVLKLIELAREGLKS